MRRPAAAKALVALTLGLCVGVSATATAKVTEMGELGADVRPSCPDACQALARVTGYQAKVGPERSLYQAPADGRIVAWTISLGKPTTRDTAAFQKRFGEVSQAAVVVLDAGKKLSRTVVAKAPLQRLNDYFGQTIQFPLVDSIAIKKGQYVALTVPTWAPALQVGLGPDTSWRSSRPAKGCLDTAPQAALVGRKTNALFSCLYKGVRLTYSATFVSTPTPNAK